MSVVREDLTEKEEFEHRTEGSEAVSYMVIWNKVSRLKKQQV